MVVAMLALHFKGKTKENISTVQDKREQQWISETITWQSMSQLMDMPIL